MANWSNLRLVVTGTRDDLARFCRAAGALKGRIKTSKSKVFTSEMELGEGGDLHADGVRLFHRAFRQASYRFQGVDDYIDHFRTISRTFPTLALVLVWSDPNADSHGSYLLLNGKKREWHVPRRTEESLFKKHYHAAGVVDAKGEIDYDADEADAAEWEAFFEMMDVAEKHWDDAVMVYVKSQPRPTAKRKKAQRLPARHKTAGRAKR